MPSSSSLMKNYSKCPLKKRPVHFTFEESAIPDQPENLSLKKEVENISSDDEEIEVGGSPVPMHETNSPVVIPTPTYPKFTLQPWSFHIPYARDFYHNIHPSHNTDFLPQISPLRGDLHSPNTSSSEGSLSPPPHYLNGRSSSVSPPIRGDAGFRVSTVNDAIMKSTSQHSIKSEIIGHSSRFMPYQMPAVYHPYIMDLGSHKPVSHHQPPVSPSYSDASSYYSHRSVSPESRRSPVPEDLSLKHSSKSSDEFHQSSHRAAYVPVEEKSIPSNNPPRYQCPHCQKSYSTFSGLTKHQQFHCPAAEGNQAKKSFSCKDCDKTYVSLGALKMHIRTHTLPCKCTICGKAFSRPWLLQGHIRTHTGEKPFSCQHCHRAFADRSNLRAHLQTHSDIKKYSCITCSKTFSRMSLLSKHTEGGCSNAPGNAHKTLVPTYTDMSSF